MGELERYGLLALLAVTVLAVGFLLEEVRVLRGPEQVFELESQRGGGLTRALSAEVGTESAEGTPGGGEPGSAGSDLAADDPDARDGFDFFEPPAALPGMGREYPEPPTPRAAGSSDSRRVQVQKNDTLEKIARRELGSARRWREILKLNAGLEPERMRAGIWLDLPPREVAVAPSVRRLEGQRVHLVEKGDNFESLAEKYYSDRRRWMAIFEANRQVCSSPEKLRAGIRIVIP